MKVACVLITHLPVKAEMRRHPRLRRNPIIISGNSDNGSVVLDASVQVEGVVTGMPLQQVVSRFEGATLLEEDNSYYVQVFDRILEALLCISPTVEKSGLGCAFVGIRGLESMYRGDSGVVTALLNAVPQGLSPRIGVAEAKFPAYVAASTSESGRVVRVLDDIQGFLQDRSLHLLPISRENKTRLLGFGLNTMGDVAALSLGSLQAQFGVEGRLAWELCNGIDDSLLVPLTHKQSVTEYMAFSPPTMTLDVLLCALDVLLGRIFASPTISGKYIREMSIEACVLNRPTWTRGFAFKTPVNTKEKAIFALKGLLEAVEMPGPLEDFRVTVQEITGESGVQSSFITGIRKQEQIRETMRQLETRLRTKPPVYRIMDVEPWSRIPERRQALVQYAP